MLCREHRVGNLQEFFETLKNINRFGAVNNHLPRSFIISGTTIDYTVGSLPGKEQSYRANPYDSMTSIMRDDERIVVAFSDGKTKHSIWVEPVQKYIRFPTAVECRLFGTTADNENAVLELKRY